METIQIFVSNPQGWAVPAPLTDAGAFIEGAREIGLDPVVVHAKYLINLASPDAEHRERSARALAAELVAAGSLGAALVVVHSGSHAGSGEEKGMERLVEGLVRARELAPEEAGADGVAKLAEPLVENSVGAGTQLCSTFDALAWVAERAGVRVCVDTAHAYVAGHDLSTPEGARRVASELGGTLGSVWRCCTSTTPGTGSVATGMGTRGSGKVTSRGRPGRSFSGSAGGSGGNGDAVRDAGDGRRAGTARQGVGGRVVAFAVGGIESLAMKTLEIHPPQTKTDLLSATGETLRAIRTESGLTLRQVAEGAHVSVSYLAEIERGEKDPSSRVLESVAGGLGIEVRALLLRIAATLQPETPAVNAAEPVAGTLAA